MTKRMHHTGIKAPPMNCNPNPPWDTSDGLTCLIPAKHINTNQQKKQLTVSLKPLPSEGILEIRMPTQTAEDCSTKPTQLRPPLSKPTPEDRAKLWEAHRTKFIQTWWLHEWILELGGWPDYEKPTRKRRPRAWENHR